MKTEDHHFTVRSFLNIHNCTQSNLLPILSAHLYSQTSILISQILSNKNDLIYTYVHTIHPYIQKHTKCFKMHLKEGGGGGEQNVQRSDLIAEATVYITIYNINTIHRTADVQTQSNEIINKLSYTFWVTLTSSKAVMK